MMEELEGETIVTQEIWNTAQQRIEVLMRELEREREKNRIMRNRMYELTYQLKKIGADTDTKEAIGGK